MVTSTATSVSMISRLASARAERIADEEIDWDIMFAQPLSGHYGNLTLFIVNGLLRLANTFDGPFNFTLVNIIGGCNDAWSVQETLIQANLKNGLRCDEVVVWATRWDPDDKRVRQVRTYVDSGWTTTAILGNEASTNASWRDTRTDFIPGPYGMPNLTEILGFPQVREIDSCGLPG